MVDALAAEIAAERRSLRAGPSSPSATVHFSLHIERDIRQLTTDYTLQVTTAHGVSSSYLVTTTREFERESSIGTFRDWLVASLTERSVPAIRTAIQSLF